MSAVVRLRDGSSYHAEEVRCEGAFLVAIARRRHWTGPDNRTLRLYALREYVWPAKAVREVRGDLRRAA